MTTETPREDDADVDAADTQSNDDLLDGEGGGEGIELTTGEPNTFEPEEEPDAQ